MCDVFLLFRFPTHAFAFLIERIRQYVYLVMVNIRDTEMVPLAVRPYDMIE